MKKMFSKYFKLFKKNNAVKEGEILKDVEALVNLNSLIDIYLPWSGSALSPSLIKLILNDVIVHNRKNIVECGSGMSTLYIASLIKQYSLDDIKVYSIDHNLEWINIVQSYLNRLEIEKNVQLIHAPLKSFENDFHEVLWYETSILNKYLKDISVDQLIVDGPPVSNRDKKYIRYPAAVFFEKKFEETYSIFLDDYNRKGEKVIAKKWSEMLNIEFKHKYDNKSFVIAMKGRHFNI